MIFDLYMGSMKIRSTFFALFALCLAFSLTARAPAENPADTSIVWDGTDADSVETSEEHFIKAYNVQCNAHPKKEYLLKDFGVYHIYTRTLPSGEVQPYVETEVTRTERKCKHMPPAEEAGSK